MQTTKAGVMAALVAAAVSGAASAQEAVEWRVEDGGNGHWYATTSAADTGNDALILAAALGGHLVCINSQAENDFIAQLFLATQQDYAWIGLRQASGQTSPDAGWYWITGEPLIYSNWTDHDGGYPTGAPDDSPCALPPWGIENDQANQGVMDQSERWDDIEVGLPTCGSPSWSNVVAIIEWSADCNADGIVDFGQIRAGELEDLNGNNIPDCCEDGSSCAPCVADVIEDGAVNGVDLAAVINAWGTDGGKLPRTDIDRNGVVDGADLAILLSAWGACG